MGRQRGLMGISGTAAHASLPARTVLSSPYDDQLHVGRTESPEEMRTDLRGRGSRGLLRWLARQRGDGCDNRLPRVRSPCCLVHPWP